MPVKHLTLSTDNSPLASTEYSIKVNNPTNEHEGEYDIHVSEDNWVYAPEGAYTEVCFEKYNMIPSHQIYIPSEIIHNMFLKKTDWALFDDKSDSDGIFKARCEQIAKSSVFQGDRYIDLENYSELVSDIGERSTIAGVFTAVFSDGKFIGLTHIDFVIFGKVDKSLLLAVEVDGFDFHKDGTRQHERDRMKNRILEKYHIPIIRFSTVGSGEKDRLISSLIDLLGE